MPPMEPHLKQAVCGGVRAELDEQWSSFGLRRSQPLKTPGGPGDTPISGAQRGLMPTVVFLAGRQ